jgi:hypothetical protein
MRKSQRQFVLFKRDYDIYSPVSSYFFVATSEKTPPPKPASYERVCTIHVNPRRGIDHLPHLRGKTKKTPEKLL